MLEHYTLAVGAVFEVHHEYGAHDTVTIEKLLLHVCSDGEDESGINSFVEYTIQREGQEQKQQRTMSAERFTHGLARSHAKQENAFDLL